MDRVQGGGQSNHGAAQRLLLSCAPICLAAAGFSPCRSHSGAALDVNQPPSFPPRWATAAGEAVQRVTRRGGRRTAANKVWQRWQRVARSQCLFDACAFESPFAFVCLSVARLAFPPSCGQWAWGPCWCRPGAIQQGQPSARTRHVIRSMPQGPRLQRPAGSLCLEVSALPATVSHGCVPIITGS